MIDLLIPVLGRPANAQPLVDSIHAATTVEHTIIFIASRDDHEQIEASKATGAVVLLSDDGRYAAKINLGATWPLRNAASEFLFLGADDLRFHPGWDEAAIACHERMGALVIGTDDRGNPSVMAGNHATHSLVHRSYVERGTIDDPTKLLHGYQHNFVDNEFVATAKARGVWAFAAGSVVEHEHWLWGKGADDRVYELGRRTYHADARLWRKRQRLLR